MINYNMLNNETHPFGLNVWATSENNKGITLFVGALN